MAELIARTRAKFEEGRPLCDRVGRELRFEMRLTWLGGMSILDRIEARAATSSSGVRTTARSTRPRSPGAPGAGARHERQCFGAPHAPERDQLLLRVPHPAPSQAARHLRALLVLPGGRRLRRRARRRARGGPRALDWPRSQRAYAGAPETQLGRELAETVAELPDPARLPSRTSWPAAGWTSRRGATRPSRSCASTASAWPRRSGLASIEIFGYDDPGTREYAVELGLALQLTNILRDIAQDAARGRIYLPLEDLARFGVSEPRCCGGTPIRPAAPAGAHGLLAFEADRARSALRGGGAAAAGARPPRDARRPSDGRRLSRAARRDGRGAAIRSAARGAAAQAAQGSGSRCARCARVALGRMKVVVVGGGFAGLAAAITLQERRHEVVLLERRGLLGGRATSSRDARDRRRRGQRHAPDDRRLTARRSTCCGAPGPTTCCCIQRRPALEWIDERGVTRPRLPAARRRRSTCWSAFSACACRSRSSCRRSARPRRALRPAPRRADARRVLPAHAARATRRAGCCGTRSRSRSSTSRRSAPRRCCSSASTGRPSWRPRASRLVFLRRGWGVLHERLARYFESRGGAFAARRSRRGARDRRAARRGRALSATARDPRRDRAPAAAGDHAACGRRDHQRGAAARAAGAPAGGAARASRRSRRCAASPARRSSRSRSGSTAWWSTARCSACATRRWSGSSTRDGSTAAPVRRSISPSS